MEMSSNTYFVLDTISTFPVLVPLQDFCRANKCGASPQELQDKGYIAALQRKNIQDNEKIVIYCKQNDYQLYSI